MCIYIYLSKLNWINKILLPYSILSISCQCCVGYALTLIVVDVFMSMAFVFILGRIEQAKDHKTFY